MISAILSGFFTSLSLILVIGAQNTVVLRQGLLRSHVLWSCIFCTASDIILFIISVFWLASVTSFYSWVPIFITWVAIIFLSIYGLLRLWASLTSDYSSELNSPEHKSLSQVMVTLGIVTWLNPHVYLDNFAIIGGISIQFEALHHKIAYTISASAASFIFFFSLGYGAIYIAPYFQSKAMWQRLDFAIALIMFIIAFQLFIHL